MKAQVGSIHEVLTPPSGQGVCGEVSEGHDPGLPLLLGSLQRVHSSHGSGESQAGHKVAKLLIIEIDGFGIFFLRICLRNIFKGKVVTVQENLLLEGLLSQGNLYNEPGRLPDGQTAVSP